MNARHLPILIALFAFVTLTPTHAEPPSQDSSLPVVQSAEMPIYPELARQAQIEGTVNMQVWTDGKCIVKVQTMGAHKLLMDAAEQNVRTWRFYPHKSQSFGVTFVYNLDREEVAGRANSSIASQLPTRVEIRSKRTKPETDRSY